MYNLSLRRTNERLFLALITQPPLFVFVFVSIVCVFVFLSVSALIVFRIVQFVHEEHKRASLPRTNNSTTIIHLELGPTYSDTLDPGSGCEKFEI